jgi:quercetin dioxygenase-like cupin family protein
MMRIQRAGAVPSAKGGPEQFAEPPGRVGINLVTFEPGARTHWHTHPAGQVLIVTAGRGWARVEGGPRRDILPGDSVWFPAGVRHWHGATDETSVSHIAIAEVVDGTNVVWLEPVADADYLSG